MYGKTTFAVVISADIYSASFFSNKSPGISTFDAIRPCIALDLRPSRVRGKTQLGSTLIKLHFDHVQGLKTWENRFTEKQKIPNLQDVDYFLVLSQDHLA